MNTILLLFSLSWIIFVIRSLVKGSKIEYQTDRVRTIYWTLIGLCFAYVIYYAIGFNVGSAIWMAIMAIITMLYACIPSGFDSKGIYVRGNFYPYKKMQNLKGEYVSGKYRINFMSNHVQMFIEAHEDRDREMKCCEKYYKEAIRND